MAARDNDEETARLGHNSITERSRMSVLDLGKATVICGVVAFLFYSFPILGQILTIGFLSVLWLSYAHKTVMTIRRRWFA